MRDLLIEEIFPKGDRENSRYHSRKDPVVPAASRYPRSAKRAELERGRQPWAMPQATPPAENWPPQAYA